MENKPLRKWFRVSVMRTGLGHSSWKWNSQWDVTAIRDTDRPFPPPPSSYFESTRSRGSNCLAHSQITKKSGYQEHKVLTWVWPPQSLPEASLVSHARDASGFAASDLFHTDKKEPSSFNVKYLHFFVCSLIPSKIHCYLLFTQDYFWRKKKFPFFFQ